MANTIITNKLATLVALKMAKNAQFLKVGSEDYFGDQVNSAHRPGMTYTFIKPSAGKVVKGVVAPGNEIKEKSVEMSIENWVNDYNLNILENALEANDEEKWASRYAQNTIDAILAEKVPEAVGASTVAFVGKGFKAISKACKYVQKISGERTYGFIDHLAEGVLTANGQQLNPVGSPDGFYSEGSIGSFDATDFYPQRFLPEVEVSEALAGATISASVNGDGTEVTITSDVELPVGYPVIVKGLLSCDILGNKTNQDRSFVVTEAGTSHTFSIETGVGGIADTAIVEGATLSVKLLPAGLYHIALVRADGSYDYTPVNTVKFKWANENAVGIGDVDGVKVAINGFSDGTAGQNKVRFDTTVMAGVAENRGMALAYVLDEE